MTYYKLTKDGPSAGVRIETYPDRNDFIESVRSYYRETLSGEDKGASQQIWLFEGTKIRFSGDPLRVMTFADGSAVPLFENNPAVADENLLLPPSIRTRTMALPDGIPES